MVSLPAIPGVSWETESTEQQRRQYARGVAQRYGVDPDSYERQIDQESRFDPKARNPSSGAAGIAQFMPATAVEEGIDPYDWKAALEAGARYRAKQTQYFGGDDRAGLASYNYGAGNVERLKKQYGADWEAYLPEETKTYLANVAGGGASGGTPGAGAIGGSALQTLPPGLVQRAQARVQREPGFLFDTRSPAPEAPEPLPGLPSGTLLGRLMAPADTGIGMTLDYGPATQQVQQTSDAFARLGEQGINGRDVFKSAKAASDEAIGSVAKPATSALGDVLQRGLRISGVGGALDLLGYGSEAEQLRDKTADFAAPMIVPQNTLDAVLTVGPGNIAKGGGKLLGLGDDFLRGGGVASRIIPKNAKQLDNAMEATLKLANEARDAVLARGGSAQEARQAAAAAMREAGKAASAVDDVTMATDRAVARDPFTNTGKRLRQGATELANRMGGAGPLKSVVPNERPKTAWTVTRKDGSTFKAETLAGAPSSSPEEAAERLARATEDYNAIGDMKRAGRARGRANMAREGIEKLKADAKTRVDKYGFRIARATVASGDEAVENYTKGTLVPDEVFPDVRAHVYQVVNNDLRGTAGFAVDKVLRKDMTPTQARWLDAQIKGMDDAVRQSPLSAPTKAYRGLPSTAVDDLGVANWQPGKVLTDAGFPSFSTDVAQATKYNFGGAGVLFEVNLPKGARAAAGHAAEAELVLPRGSSFKVLSVTKDGKRYRVALELASPSSGLPGSQVVQAGRAAGAPVAFDARGLVDDVVDEGTAAAREFLEQTPEGRAWLEAVDAAKAAGRELPEPNETVLGTIARVAKTLGDPAGRLREKLTEDRENAVSRKGRNFGDDADRVASERVKSRDGLGEVALRQGPKLDDAMHDLAQGLEVNPDAIGLQAPEELTRRLEKWRAGSKSKNMQEPGRVAAQEKVWELVNSGASPARVIDEMSDAYMYMRGATPRERGFIDEMQRLQEKLLDLSGGETAINWNAVRTEAEGFVARGASAFDDDFRRAAEAERKLGPQVERQGVRDAAAAERRRVAEHQSRVEAADLARNRDEWLKTRDEALAKAAEKPARDGTNPLKEILGIIGLTRTLPTSADVGGIMRNTAVLGASRPAKWMGAAKAQLKAAFSEANAQTYQKAVEGSPNYSNAVERWGWHANDWGPNAKARVPERSGMQEGAVIAGKVLNFPGVKQIQESSERSLAIGRNVLGMDVIDEYANAYKAATGMPSTQLVPDEAMDKYMQAVVRVVNHANGWSELARGKDPLGVFFSLPYTISRFQIVTDPIVEALRGNPDAAKLALSNLVNFAGANAAMLSFLALTGERSGRWSVNFNPTDGDFGQLRVGNTRFDTLAGMGPIIKTASRLGANVAEGDVTNLIPDLMRFFENKETPVFKAFTDAWVRRAGLPGLDEAKNAILPMMLSSVIDAFRDGENPFIIGAGAAASAVGVGANTYKTPQDEANAAAKERYGGKDFEELTPLERLTVLDPEDRSQKGPRAKAREDYNQALEKAGYVMPEQAEPGETKVQADARAARNKKLEPQNDAVYRSNPELDVQRWYYGNKFGGSVNSPEAAALALDLKLPDRAVTLYGLPRALNADPGTEKLYREKADLLEQYFNPPEDLRKAYAGQEKYKGKKPEEIESAVLAEVRAAIRKVPAIDAMLVYMGHGGDADSKSYLLHSLGTVEELQKLWDANPSAPKFAREGYGVRFASGVR